MSDHIFNYWLEAVRCSVEDNGIVLPDGTDVKVAHDMAIAAENQSMAFGYRDRPSKHPEKSDEVKRLEARIKELEERDLIFRQAVATRRRVPVEDVYIESGDVKYDIHHRY